MFHSSISRTLRARIVACTLVLFFSSGVFAKKHAEGGFNKTEIKAVSKLLKRYGVVALSETKQGVFKAMTLAVRIDAPRQTVFDIFKDPLKFNYLSSLFEEAKVLDNHAESKAYSCASEERGRWCWYPPR